MVLSKCNISIGCWNIDNAFTDRSSGRICKLTLPHIFNTVSDFDIFCLVETHCGPKDSLDDFLPDYKFVESTRPKHPKGPTYSGGIAIGYKNSISAGIKTFKVTDTEIIYIKLLKEFFKLDRDLFIFCVYVAPSDSVYFTQHDSVFDRIENHIAKFSMLGSCLVCGDFNARTQRADDFCSNFISALPLDGSNIISDPVPPERNNLDPKKNSHGKCLLELCKASNMRILNGRFLGDTVGSCTCFSPVAKTPSAIDYMLFSSKCLDMVDYFQVHDLTAYSIHCIISTVLITGKYFLSDSDSWLSTFESYKWCKGDSEKFNQIIASAEFSKILLDSADPNLSVNNQVTSLSEALIKAADKTKIRKVGGKPKSKRRKNQKWFDKDCSALFRHIRKLAKKLHINPNQDTLKIFHAKKKEYRKLLKRKKIEFKNKLLNEMDYLHSRNPKEYWKIFDKLKNLDSTPKSCSVGIDPLVTYFESLLNKKYLSSDPTLDAHMDSFISENKNTIFNELNFSISLDEISKAIDRLKINKASGTDLILNEMLKAGKSSLLPILHTIFNRILLSGNFPDSWRCNILSPVYKKKGDKSLPENYRGIAVSSNLCKLFCSVLHERLSKFCSKASIVPDCQIGYQKNSRPSDHIFVLKSVIDKYLNRKKWLYCCFVDFRACFDSLSRKALIYKLLKNGVGGTFLEVIISMYQSVNYCVKVNNKISETFSSTAGVKQGGVLSPLLFNILVSDLPEIFDSCDPVMLWDKPLPCLQFADDLVLISSTSTGLQNAIDSLHNYCAKWNLCINTSKTKVLIFNPSGKIIKSVKFSIGGFPLENVHSYCYLGITFSASGSFSKAWARLYDQARKALFKFKQIDIRSNVNVAFKLFESLILPIITYGAEIWGVYSVKLNGADFFGSCEKFPVESLLLKFSKYLLGVRNNSCTAAVRGELGQYPIICKVLISILSNWNRITNSNKSGFLYRAYLDYCDGLVNYKNDKSNYARIIRNILNFFNFDEVWHNQRFSRKVHIKKYFRNSVHRLYESAWKTEMDKKDKLRSYRIFKSDYCIEPYLLCLPFDVRRKMTKLRISSHRLQIEVGRFNGTPVDDRICDHCLLSTVRVIEDEFHAVLVCSKYTDIRTKVFDELALFTNFNSLSDDEKFKFILSYCKDTEIVKIVSPLIDAIISDLKPNL